MRNSWRDLAGRLAERYVDRRLRLAARLRGDCPDEWEYRGAMHCDSSRSDASRSHP